MRRLLWLLGVIAAASGCEGAGETDELSQNEIFQRMQRQPKFRPYQRNDLYEDARAMRTPPPGAVSRESYAAGQGGIDTGLTPNLTHVEKIPVPIDDALLATGRKNFEVVCGACHGITGDGKSMVAQNLSLMPPPSFHSEKLRAKPDGYFFEVISNGFGAMPSLAWRFTPRDRWAVVAYVRALQYSQHVPIAEAPSDIQQRLMREGQ